MDRPGKYAEDYFTAVGEAIAPGFIQRCLLWRAPGVVQQGGAEFLADTNVETHRGIGFGDGMFVSVGGTRAVPNSGWIGKISSSPTGGNPWASQDQMIEPRPETYFQLHNLLLDVAYGVGKFVAAGEGGLLVESGPAVRFDPRLARLQADGQLEFGALSLAGSRVQIQVMTEFGTWSNMLEATNTSGTLRFQVTPKLRFELLRALLISP
ncbi:MAG: hypothetical protein AB9869_09100 [Verrucomicrobiia bacterium]